MLDCSSGQGFIKDDDIGVKSNASELGAVEVPKAAPPKDDLDERMKSIFG